MVSAAPRMQFIWIDFAVPVDIHLIEKRARICGELIEIHAAIALEIDERRIGRLILLPTLLIDGARFIGVEATGMLHIGFGEIRVQALLHLGPRDYAIVIEVVGLQNTPDRPEFWLFMSRRQL